MPVKKSTRRRARGTGALFFSEKRQVWIGRVQVGRKASGAPLYAERSAKTQAACLKKLQAAGPPGADTTVAQWAERWLESLDVRKGTRSLIENNTRVHFIPTLGTKRLAAVTAWDVESAHRRWGLAASTTSTALGHLGLLFQAAIRAGLIARNPVPLASRPRREPKEIDPFAAPELARIIAAATELPGGHALAVLAATGCRIGEAIGLDVGDYDATAGTLSITRTASDHHGIGPPKTRRGVRTIAVPTQARPAIIAAIAGRKAGPLFMSGRARQSQAELRRRFTRVLRDLGLRPRNPHQMRHSVATLLIAAGHPIADVAAYLGDTVDTVVKTYLHPTGECPANLLDRLLSGGKVGAAT